MYSNKKLTRKCSQFWKKKNAYFDCTWPSSWQPYWCPTGSNRRSYKQLSPHIENMSNMRTMSSLVQGRFGHSYSIRTSSETRVWAYSYQKGNKGNNVKATAVPTGHWSRLTTKNSQALFHCAVVIAPLTLFNNIHCSRSRPLGDLMRCGNLGPRGSLFFSI